MPAPTPYTQKALAPIGPMLWHQARTEVLRLWRTPSFLGPTIILPLVLYTILGGLGRGDAKLEAGVSAHVYALASVATYSIVSIMLFSFGVNIANERSQRVTILMRATPLPASIYLLAKALSALLSALVMLLILSGFAIVVGGVQLSVTTWVSLIAALVLGVLPFIALGFAIGQMINPTGATPIVNLSFFILAFASGIFVPLSQLPDVVQNLAPYSPFYRLAQLAWNAIGVQTASGSIGEAIWLLALYAAIFFVLALYAYRKEERHSFG
ncbi:MAG TPA: ABC transporter permease [Ktedonobacteraceae bacterium]|jgi:ABC-2 type transport system permease protein|nr:ABC transporter permease [Ktedonobacteraceae bacterium]